VELSWLEDFITLSITLNFSRAAERRNLTQPAFSRRIRNLETWLGVELVDRSTFPATLTAEGRSFRKAAEEMVQNIYREREHCLGLAVAEPSFHSFVTLHTIAVSFFPQWLHQLESRLGPLRTRVVCAPMHDCVENLASGTSDFMLFYAHPSAPLRLDPVQFPSVVIGRERLVPVSAPGRNGRPLHPLSQGTRKAVPYLRYARHTFTTRLIDIILADKSHPPMLEARHENALTLSLRSMAMEGHGMTWLPETSIKNEIESGALVMAGSKEWSLNMEIRAYRSVQRGQQEKELLWTHLSTLAVA
jgi:LysR family transcriptional regulator, hypochlorite-specific transcription factor HypT